MDAGQQRHALSCGGSLILGQSPQISETEGDNDDEEEGKQQNDETHDEVDESLLADVEGESDEDEDHQDGGEPGQGRQNQHDVKSVQGNHRNLFSGLADLVVSQKSGEYGEESEEGKQGTGVVGPVLTNPPDTETDQNEKETCDQHQNYADDSKPP